MSENTFDIIIQGKYTEYTDTIINLYSQISCVNNVIISCWEDDKEIIYPKDNSEKVKFIKNKYPLSPGTANKNLQILSSLQGLKESTSQYAIKTRSDFKHTSSSILEMFNFFLENKQSVASYQYESNNPKGRIFVAGIYTNLLFHPNDHCYFGYTKDLITLFDIPLEYNGLCDKIKVGKYQLFNYLKYFTSPETYIGAHYCANFNEEINLFLLNPEKYLYGESPYWNYAYEVSSNIIKSAFKSFPKNTVDFEWGFKPWYNRDEYISVRSWHEDGY
jgi:hypothetical protein